MIIIGEYDDDYYDCHTSSGWRFQTFFIFHNIWDNPSHWRSYFSRCLKPPTRLTSIQGMITIHEGNPGTAICPTRTLGVFADATPIGSAGQIQLWGDVWIVWFLMSLLRKKLACFCCFILCHLFAWPSKILDSHLGLFSTFICHFSTVFGGAPMVPYQGHP